MTGAEPAEENACLIPALVTCRCPNVAERTTRQSVRILSRPEFYDGPVPV